MPITHPDLLAIAVVAAQEWGGPSDERVDVLFTIRTSGRVAVSDRTDRSRG